jgi:hypothetical protein
MSFRTITQSQSNAIRGSNASNDANDNHDENDGSHHSIDGNTANQDETDGSNATNDANWSATDDNQDENDMTFYDNILFDFPTEEPRCLNGRFYEKASLEGLVNIAINCVDRFGRPNSIKRMVRNHDNEFLEAVYEPDGTQWCQDPSGSLRSSDEGFWIPRILVAQAMNTNLPPAMARMIRTAAQSHESRTARRDVEMARRAAVSGALVHQENLRQRLDQNHTLYGELGAHLNSFIIKKFMNHKVFAINIFHLFHKDLYAIQNKAG